MRSLTRTLCVLGVAASLVASITLMAPSPAMAWAGCQDIADTLPIPSNANKATLCHFTGSESNPFVINGVSLSAVDAHQTHHGDCVKFFDGTLVCF